ncbi:SLC18A2 [Branchiostoma lanceolatum]|uniref:SLC18A2 protein n=1 Tax=Branchiostoma lanceolatum TaxID=7740 RepID=A0A8J9YKB3_BRALA|nr:SLC18A2 [Branchiostoma lanceolatum]
MQKKQKLASFPYYWGNSPALDLIKIDQNEGEYPDKMAVLLAGVGNLRNVMATVAGLKQPFDGSVHFVLNDNDRQVLARNVFFLHFLWKYKGEENVAQQLTQIWYSVKIAEEEATMAQESLTELLSLPGGTDTLCGDRVTMSAEQFSQIRPVFELWLSLLTGEKVLQMTPQEQLRLTYQIPSAADGVDMFLHCIPKRHRSAANDWFTRGILLPRSDPRRKRAFRDNLTLAAWTPDVTPLYRAVQMLQGIPISMTAQYVGEIAAAINDDGVPFSEWDYLEVKAKYHQHDLLKMYSHYMFNVSDYINYPVLLETLRPLLRKENSKSVIITESINWTLYFPTEEVIPPFLRNMSLWKDLFQHAIEDLRHEPDRPGWAKGEADQQSTLRNATNTSIVEYLDNWELFNQYLRAALLVHKCPEFSHPVFSTKDVPKMSEVRNVSGMKMRDFLQELNTVCPFRHRINARRVNLLNGHERMLEFAVTLADMSQSSRDRFDNFRKSDVLVVFVAILAVFGDTILDTVVDPIMPDYLYRLEHPNYTGDIITHFAAYEKHTTSGNMQTPESCNLGATCPAVNTSQSELSQRAKELELQSIRLGILYAAKSTVALVTNPIAGVMTDRFGTNVPLYTGLVIVFSSTIAYAFSKSYTTLFVSRVIQGVGTSFSNVAAFAMVIAVFHDKEDRAKNVGFVNTGRNFGVLVGPVIGGVMYQFVGYSSPFLLIAGMTLVDGLLRLLLPKRETAPNDEDGDYSIFNLLKDPYVMTTAGITSTTLITETGYLADIRHGSRYGTAYAIAENAICLGIAVGLASSGTLLNALGFPWMMRTAGLLNVLLSPAALLLRNPPKRQEKFKLAIVYKEENQLETLSYKPQPLD